MLLPPRWHHDPWRHRGQQADEAPGRDAHRMPGTTGRSRLPPYLGDPVAFRLSEEGRQFLEEALGPGSGLQVQQPAALKARHGPPLVVPVHQLPELNAVGVGGGRHLHGSGTSVIRHDAEVVHPGLLAVVVLLDLQAQRGRDGGRNHPLLRVAVRHATTVPTGGA
jgi:hypothetical protein